MDIKFVRNIVQHNSSPDCTDIPSYYYQLIIYFKQMDSEEDLPVKLTINSKYAKKYEERKRGEELSKREQVL
jgi:hypothetical protein